MATAMVIVVVATVMVTTVEWRLLALGLPPDLVAVRFFLQ